MRFFSLPTLLRLGLFVWACLAPLSLQAGPRSLPQLPIPGNFGVSLHFTRPLPGEMELLAQANLGWIRMDVTWESVETQAGVYDFSNYDHLVENLEKYGIKAVFILDYANPLYDQGLSPHTDAGRKAFARFAVAAAQRYAGKGYLWEVWNEPNQLMFWFPKPKIEDYILLMKEVGQAFQRAKLEEPLIGPAASKIPFGILKKCLKAGLLEYWSGLSVHPYRKWRHPETAVKDYRRLKKIMKKYLPENREIPILSSEWGYSSAQLGIDAEKQAKYLPRMWLSNLAAGIPLSIWYDWKDDGLDPKEKEHHFGLVTHDLKIKPVYLAAQTLTRQLEGFTFEKRLSVGSGRDYVLQFRKGEEVRYAAWTSSPQARTRVLKGIQGNFAVVDYLGKELETRSAEKRGLSLGLVDSPRYLRPISSSASTDQN